MINAANLLADLKRLRKSLDADLRVTHSTGVQRDAVHTEWREAFDQGRTRDTFEVFLDGAFDQSVVHWILGCVFLRFLEDNLLIDRPFISGPGEQLELAKERQDAHFRTRPHDSDTEYLLAVFAEVAQLPGIAGLYAPAHNPLFRLPLSGDGAMALIRFFREVLPETGELKHDFTDPEWDTRFLGDLYQDLSEEARKRYALLQTPEFVEEWILDRTLEPAIREFGHEQVTMIDPACGSGHFLLGGFDRVLREWRRFAPDLPQAELAQRALDAIAGVDLNPFATEIARFRLLLTALRAANVRRLSAAPNFRMHLATGDSLLHGQHFFRHELGGTEEGFRRVLHHHYTAEDTAEVDTILGRQYHAVVGNPPYITPKDPAMRDAYREIYDSCHMKYGLGAPFTERFFDLTKSEVAQSAGFVGLIVANSFMKREFGSKLIQEVLPRLDLTHIVDCSGAYIPGHGTPTVILFGRNRRPVERSVRTVRGIRGEPAIPAHPAQGLVWSAIVAQADLAQSTSSFISSEDTPRDTLASHPWNMGGGGAADVQAMIEDRRERLGDRVFQIGFSVVTGADEAFASGGPRDLRRITGADGRPFVSGEDVRDYRIRPVLNTIWPYDHDFESVPLEAGTLMYKHFWPLRTTLSNRKLYGKPFLSTGLRWHEYGEVNPNKQRIPLSLTFAEVATHNHFALDRGGSAFRQTAPVIKLPANASEDDHLGLLGLLNSSIAGFWLQQVCHNKGGPGGGSSKDEKWHDFFQLNGTAVGKMPICEQRPLALARSIDAAAQRLSFNLPAAVCARGVPVRSVLDEARSAVEQARSTMIALQEELDWLCYRLYELFSQDLGHSNPPPLHVGERAFEILLARRMASGVEDTRWFEWLGATAITEIPSHWAADYRATVERRIDVIESDPNIALIERQSFKRRWEAPSWEDMEREALYVWLLDRLEDSPVWSTGDPRLVSTNQLADLMRRDDDFVAVATLYMRRADIDLEALTAELISKEAVPFCANLRYTETGLRKHGQWKETWERQRLEDRIDADVAERRDAFRAQAERHEQVQWRNTNPRRPGEEIEPYAIRMQAASSVTVEREIDRKVSEEQHRRKREEIGDIPVPPKYVAKDFQSADFWRLRGGLDVPSERFVSFPCCERDVDGSTVVIWAGHNYLKRALAIAAYYQERKDNDGWAPGRLVPLLAGVIELLPWLLQWHNNYDPDLGARMGDYFVDFVQTEARALGLTEAAVAAWTPPATPRRGRSRRIAA